MIDLIVVVWLQVSKGSVPPNFTLKDQNGKPVSLNKFKGKPVVVYFYPADETPGCTKQVSFLRKCLSRYFTETLKPCIGFVASKKKQETLKRQLVVSIPLVDF